MNYQEFLDSKRIVHKNSGIDVPVENIHPSLFDWQKQIVRWALKKGRCCLFEECGLGKTRQQLEWARWIPGKVLILAPLAVGPQTAREADAIELKAPYMRFNGGQTILVTNYEILDRFNPDEFDGIVLDESSILKSFTGKIRNQIIDSFRKTTFKMACSATPAPNDHMELGNHSEFVGSLSRTEMLSTFFVHDGGDTSKWRLKRHAEREFWKWVASWAVMMRKPSDLGFSDDGYILPSLNIQQIVVDSEWSVPGYLFPVPANTLSERREARRDSIEERCGKVVEIVEKSPDEQWIIWCNLNAESSLVSKLLGAIEVTGSQKPEYKEECITRFSQGIIRKIVTKPDIFGYGLNLQNCHNMVFLGLSDSWEAWYQSVRRCWRFGQTMPVNVWVVTSSAEGAVVENIQRKEKQAGEMAEGMVAHMSEINRAEIEGVDLAKEELRPEYSTGGSWEMALDDTVSFSKGSSDETVDYMIYSPPFASLYTYSASERDMGNCRSHADFFEHMGFIAPELFRILKSGRLMSFHCMNLPTSKERDGYIGITDFRGQLIKLFQDCGFIYHSEVCIWKDPVTAMQRTKALGLLHKQLKKDSCMSRQGIPDYLVTMRKPGENSSAVTHTNDSFPVSIWQRYASPVWMDINPNDTLQKESAREQEDERHICPLQLQVIQRGIELWANPGDLVFSPFAGIGSEGYVAVKMGRRFTGVELKRSYYQQACLNLKAAEQMQTNLFGGVDGESSQVSDGNSICLDGVDDGVVSVSCDAGNFEA